MYIPTQVFVTCYFDLYFSGKVIHLSEWKFSNSKHHCRLIISNYNFEQHFLFINNSFNKRSFLLQNSYTGNTLIPLDGTSAVHMGNIALLLKILNHSRSTSICKNLRLLRFHYTSSMLLI